ncbi:MAG TPA: methylated-DNA--[protein]-cysteine S-methyltransferase [Nitrososphaerales archaeon]|nr:methylated-DNA--[protein]-cysteine S-methyltransferase [Nitrososphaerales archaeon]
MQIRSVKPQDAKAMWRAVIERDASFFSSFVYAVNTTGVYCRPTCPSRRPREDQVVFFSTPRQAETAGYRACIRCDPRGDHKEPPGARMVRRICKFMDENYDSKITLKSLSETEGLSPFHLQRKFKEITGLSPRQYLESTRLKHLKLSLMSGESTVKSTYRAGYNSSSWLYSGKRPRLGMSPSIYKKGGESELIYYTIADCALGRLLVGGTEKGICAVSIRDSDENLVSFLKAEYPRARIVPQRIGAEDAGNGESGDFSSWVRHILDCLAQGRDIARTGLPLDIKGTAFQFRVWRELLKIPLGSTKSYNEVAKRIDCPRGSRAVANACARNHVALLIPCHRVVRQSGDIGGYRWGVQRKQHLLEQEREHAELEKKQAE